MTIVSCEKCGNSFEKEAKEVKRQNKNGYNRFFCSKDCYVQYKTLPPPEPTNKTCPRCGVGFFSINNFCSTKCQQTRKFSDEQWDRMKQKLSQHAKENPVGFVLFNQEQKTENIANGLRTREWYKYKKLANELRMSGFAFSFEYAIDGVVFDLYLREMGLLIEFDAYKKPNSSEEKRAAIAQKQGLKLIHCTVKSNEVFTFDMLKKSINDQYYK